MLAFEKGQIWTYKSRKNDARSTLTIVDPCNFSTTININNVIVAGKQRTIECVEILNSILLDDLVSVVGFDSDVKNNINDYLFGDNPNNKSFFVVPVFNIVDIVDKATSEAMKCD